MSGVHHMHAPLRQHAQRPGCQNLCVPASERAGLMLPPRARLPVSATASRLSMPAPPLTPHPPNSKPQPPSPCRRYHLLNSVLPICLCAFLGFLIYFVDVTDLASRLQVCTGW